MKEEIEEKKCEVVKTVYCTWIMWVLNPGRERNVEKWKWKALSGQTSTGHDPIQYQNKGQIGEWNKYLSTPGVLGTFVLPRDVYQFSIS